MTAALLFLAFVAGCGVGLGVLSVWLAKREQRQAVDDALRIKPPRPTVDADGRTDYRPELRERVARYREGR